MVFPNSLKDPGGNRQMMQLSPQFVHPNCGYHYDTPLPHHEYSNMTYYYGQDGQVASVNHMNSQGTTFYKESYLQPPINTTFFAKPQTSRTNPYQSVTRPTQNISGSTRLNTPQNYLEQSMSLKNKIRVTKIPIINPQTGRDISDEENFPLPFTDAFGRLIPPSIFDVDYSENEDDWSYLEDFDSPIDDQRENKPKKQIPIINPLTGRTINCDDKITPKDNPTKKPSQSNDLSEYQSSRSENNQNQMVEKRKIQVPTTTSLKTDIDKKLLQTSMNTTEKITYTKEFLLSCLQNNPKCKKKFKNLPDLNITTKNSNRPRILNLYSLKMNQPNKEKNEQVDIIINSGRTREDTNIVKLVDNNTSQGNNNSDKCKVSSSIGSITKSTSRTIKDTGQKKTIIITERAIERAIEEPHQKVKAVEESSEEDNEFDCFGKSISCQLKKLPESVALECIAYIQNYLVQQRLKVKNQLGSNKVTSSVDP